MVGDASYKRSRRQISVGSAVQFRPLLPISLEDHVTQLSDIQLLALRQLVEPSPDFLWNGAVDRAVDDLIELDMAMYSHGHGNRPIPTEKGRAAWSGRHDLS